MSTTSIQPDTATRLHLQLVAAWRAEIPNPWRAMTSREILERVRRNPTWFPRMVRVLQAIGQYPHRVYPLDAATLSHRLHKLAFSGGSGGSGDGWALQPTFIGRRRAWKLIPPMPESERRFRRALTLARGDFIQGIKTKKLSGAT